MPTFESSIHIDSPPERVFQSIADLRSAPERIAGIKRLEVLTDGPIGKGTRFRETRLMFGREATAEMEITAFDPGKSYVTHSESCGCSYRCVISVAPDAGGTRLTMSLDAKPLTFMARLLSAVTTPLMRKTLVKCLEQDFADIKRSIEQAPQPQHA